MQRLIKQAVLFNQLSPEKDRWLADKAGFIEPFTVPWFSGVGLKWTVMNIDVVSLSVNKINFRVFCKIGNDTGYGIRVIDIIGIEPADNVSFCRAYSFINCITLPFVLLRKPLYRRTELLENVYRVIGAASINVDLLHSSGYGR